MDIDPKMNLSFRKTFTIMVGIGLVGLLAFALLFGFGVAKHDKLCAQYSTTCNVTDNDWWYPINVTNFSAKCEYNGYSRIPGKDYAGWFTTDCYYNPEQDDCPTEDCQLTDEEAKTPNALIYLAFGVFTFLLAIEFTMLGVYRCFHSR